jgi:AraC family transcriptional regulator
MEETMLKPYDLLEGVLNEIENELKQNVNENALAGKFSLSSVHLRRLFRFAFGQPIGTYIRSRKLTASINDLLNTNNNIVDIVLDYGFEYEQSYIRTFKREFGITPGELRKSGQIVKITPPLQLFDTNKFEDGLFFGPDIVMVPQFHVIGKRHKMPFHKMPTKDMPIIKQFFSERQKIPNMADPDTFINICSAAAADEDYFYFMPSVQVKTLEHIPKGFDHYTFPTTLCANFRFINFFLDETNAHTADRMFQAIDDFNGDKDQKYFVDRNINIDKFNFPDKNWNCLQWEWFAPVKERKSFNIPAFNSSGIKKIYKQKLPALRFIGKKCVETSETANVLDLLADWQLKGRLKKIKKQSDIDYKTFFEGGNAYINLVRKKDGGMDERWMGMFMPKDTEVPQGYEAVDFPKSALAVCSVYGQKNEIVNYETECRNKLTEESFVIKNGQWYFLRFNWRKFFQLDIYGKIVLEYCYFLSQCA